MADDGTFEPVAAQLRAEIEAARADILRVREELTHVVRRLALVRYDAFPDVGGRTSFSAALLDSEGDGIVLTAINGRTESRAYCKRVLAGASSQELSPEEKQVIDEAMRAEPAVGDSS